MNWSTVTFDWNRARAFLVTAEEGSLSAAARALGSTQPTMGRQVAALEEELGVTLFSRSNNTLELTETGLALLEHVRTMAEGAMRVSLAAAGQAASVEGTVAITASEAVAAFLLPPILEQLRIDHPKIELELVVTNEARDLTRREADIAVRNFKPSQPDLIARKISDGRAWMYATRGYLERIGPLNTLDDLGRAEFFAFDRSTVMIEGLQKMGLDVGPEQFPILSPSHVVQWELCKQGSGICFMMEQVGDAEPAVERVLPEVVPPMPVPMWIVSHRELRTSRRIRLVFDRLVEGLAASG